MVEQAPWWSALLLPVVLAAFAVAAAMFGSVLTARTAGTAPGVAAAAPLRSAAGLLVRQRRSTLAADALLWRAAGVVLLLAGVLASLVTPLGRWSVGDLPVGVVWFNAMEVVAWAAVWLAGWGGNSAFGLSGGYRFVAQGVCYELPHMFALTTAAIGAGSLRVADIVAAQQQLWFVVWMPVAFAVFLLTVAAMAFWPPFDHPLGLDVAGGAASELSVWIGWCSSRDAGPCWCRARAWRSRSSSAAAAVRCCPAGCGRCSRRRPCWPRSCGRAGGCPRSGWSASPRSPGWC